MLLLIILKSDFLLIKTYTMLFLYYKNLIKALFLVLAINSIRSDKQI